MFSRSGRGRSVTHLAISLDGKLLLEVLLTIPDGIADQATALCARIALGCHGRWVGMEDHANPSAVCPKSREPWHSVLKESFSPE